MNQTCGGPKEMRTWLIYFDFPMMSSKETLSLKVVLEIQWGKKVFSQPPIVQVLPLKKMREACNFHHRYTSTMTDKRRKINPENHIVGFLMNLFAEWLKRVLMTQT